MGTSPQFSRDLTVKMGDFSVDFMVFFRTSEIIWTIRRFLLALKCTEKGESNGSRGSICSTASILPRISAKKTEIWVKQDWHCSSANDFGEIGGFLYLAVSMNQIDYGCF